MRMKQQFVLAIDQGTTSTRAILFDREDRIIASSKRELQQAYPHEGWVEQDPDQIWTTVLEAVSEILDQTALSQYPIASIGLANQGESLLAWDLHTGAPLYNAIGWQDNRTAFLCQGLRSEEERVSKKTGLFIDAYFSATKMKWLLENVRKVQEALRKETLRISTLDSWLLWKMTGGKSYFTDYATASRTMVFNIHTLAWDSEILQWLGIPEEVLPEVCPSSHFFGMTDPNSFSGLEAPITGSTVDQAAALFGETCFSEGQMKISYGTGAFLLMNIGPQPLPSSDRLLQSLTASTGREDVRYYLDGGIFTAGTAINWLRDELGLYDHPGQIESFCAEADEMGDVLFIPALRGLGAPHWNHRVKGAFLGLTPETNKRHLVRAVLESLAFRAKEIVDRMEEISKKKIREIFIDGGISQNEWMMQFQANLLTKTLLRPFTHEMTSLGVSHLAGLKAGVWHNKEEFIPQLKIERAFVPQGNPERYLRSFEKWERSVKRLTERVE
jgi:glycerol kinase